MKTSLLLVIPIMLSMLIGACRDENVPDGRTGISAVDMVLDAIETGDPAMVKPFVKLESYSCVPRSAPTELEPRCAEDEATGTLVQTFAMGSCVGRRQMRANADGVSEWIVSQDLSLYAVYEAPADHYLSAQHVAIFSQTIPDLTLGVALLLADGQIVGFDQDCAVPPDGMVEYLGLKDVVLPPD